MVVTDLHGDWIAYRTYRDLFLNAYQAGDIQYFILAGDLIHRESPPEEDKSLEIVLDVLALQRAYPGQIIYLCGNHEFPHIYNIVLSKGDYTYTPRFEACLGEHRIQVISLFKALPFYIRTSAGVVITHAGAAAAHKVEENSYKIFSLFHQDIFDHVEELLQGKDLESLRSGMARFSGIPYAMQAKHYLDVTGKDDPRYDDLLRGFFASSHATFDLAWQALFTRCEHDYGEGEYRSCLERLLAALSVDFVPQRFLVAGHIDVDQGYKVVAKKHLRVASGKHASPLRSAKYLILDLATPISDMKTLLSGLASIY